MAKSKKKDRDDDEKDDDKPKSKGKATMSGRGPSRNDAYVMMLFVTLVAIAAGSFLMYQDHQEYAGKQPPKEAVPAIQKLGESSKAAPAPAGGGLPAGGDAKGGDAKGGGGDMGMMP